MHYFIYPTQDTFITNITNYDNLNFGLNEILRIGCPRKITKEVSLTKEVDISSIIVTSICVSNYSGSIINSGLFGTASLISASISSSINSNVTCSLFSGTLTGSYTSASVSSTTTGSLENFSGSFNGIFNGYSYGYFWTDYIEYFSGSVIDFTGKIYSGTITGTQILDQQTTRVIDQVYSERSLLKFDLSNISKSISEGNISNPTFKLKMKIAKEQNVPIQYSLLAYPISESWEMGNGYWFDGGSSKGANWNYRDYYAGNEWTTTGSTYISSVSASQTFNYEPGDISMDITNIVNSWINGSIINNGLVILTSEETNATGSEISLYYFSKESNTIYSPYLDVGWNDFSIITGSITTGSVIITTIPSGTTSSIQSGSTINVPGGINGFIYAAAFINRIDDNINGSVSGVGESGNILNVPIFGNITGSSSLTESIITGSCGKIFNAYLITASFIDGNFSGSTFSGYYTNYKIEQAFLTGSWNETHLLGNSLMIDIPSDTDPIYYGKISSSYISGHLLGNFNISSSNSSSFNGQFYDGLFLGSIVNLQLTGSIYTSSYSYTSSVEFQTDSLEPLQTSASFNYIVKIPSILKSNEIIKVPVVGREKYPLKNFQRSTQFSQYLTPLYLPTQSFYSIKDNQSEEIILDFDNYTRLSCDLNGNYFMLDTSGLPQERYFKVLIKIEQDGSTYIMDNNDVFKVVR